MSVKKKGIDFTAMEHPDYCEQPLLLNPEDSYIAKFDEYTPDRDSYVAWFTPVSGRMQGGEMSDTVYCKGDVIPYHEHNRGTEIFLIDDGSVLVSQRGKQAVANRGDLVFIPPFTSHGFTYLEEHTVWREWFQDIKMNQGLLEQRRFRTYGDDQVSDAQFDKKIAKRLGTDWFEFEPDLKQVDKSEMPFIRDYDFAYETFEFPGIRMLQKIARYEMEGTQEIWQYRMDKGFHLEWNTWNDHGLLLAVYSGSAEIRVPGHEPFIAKEHDIINIPSYLKGEMTILEDNTVMYDYACKGYLYRALEHIRSLQKHDPEKLKDKEFMAKLLEEQYDLFITGQLR